MILVHDTMHYEGSIICMILLYDSSKKKLQRRQITNAEIQSQLHKHAMRPTSTCNRASIFHGSAKLTHDLCKASSLLHRRYPTATKSMQPGIVRAPS